MKHVRKSVAFVSAFLVLSACSSPAPEDSVSESSSQPTSQGVFPVTVSTAFEEVTIDEEPDRVVALGWGDAEMALALGVQPVGASDWLDFGGDGVGPWAEGLYEESPEIIGTMEPSFEAIAALEPDLILDVRSSGDEERYERLSEIATTVGIPEGSENYLTNTEDHVSTIATALGVPGKGEELLTELDDAFSVAAESHPEWEGMTVTAASKSSETWGAFIGDNVRVQFLEKLGFTHSPTIDALPMGSSGRSVELSTEQLDLLDADLVVAFPIWIDTQELTGETMWQQIPAVKDGRAVVIDGDLQSAYSLGSTLSTLYAVENLVPEIEEALD